MQRLGVNYETRTQSKSVSRSSQRFSSWFTSLQRTTSNTLGLIFALSIYEPVVDETDTSIMETLLAFSAIVALIAVFCLVIWWIGG